MIKKDDKDIKGRLYSDDLPVTPEACFCGAASNAEYWEDGANPTQAHYKIYCHNHK